MGNSNISNKKTEVNAPRTSTSQLQRTLACRKAKCHIDNIKDFVVRFRVSYYSPFTRTEYCLSLVIYAVKYHFQQRWSFIYLIGRQ